MTGIATFATKVIEDALTARLEFELAMLKQSGKLSEAKIPAKSNIIIVDGERHHYIPTSHKLSVLFADHKDFWVKADQLLKTCIRTIATEKDEVAVWREPPTVSVYTTFEKMGSLPEGKPIGIEVVFRWRRVKVSRGSVLSAPLTVVT